MAPTKPATLELGTISHGTMRTEDILPALLAALDGVELSAEDRQTCDEIQEHVDAWDEGATIEADDLHLAAHTEYLEVEMYDTLIPIAEDYVPDYCYIGSHPGDGSDLGVWPCDELLDDTTQGSYDGCCWRLKVNNHPTEETIPDDMTHALAVNDHGNATLYARGADGWTVCWSVV